MAHRRDPTCRTAGSDGIAVRYADLYQFRCLDPRRPRDLHRDRTPVRRSPSDADRRRAAAPHRIGGAAPGRRRLLARKAAGCHHAVGVAVARPARQSHLVALSPRQPDAAARYDKTAWPSGIAACAAAQQPAVGADPRYAGPLDHRRRAVRRRAGSVPRRRRRSGQRLQLRGGALFPPRRRLYPARASLTGRRARRARPPDVFRRRSGAAVARPKPGRPGAAGDPDQLPGLGNAAGRGAGALPRRPDPNAAGRHRHSPDAGQRKKTCSCAWTTPSRRCTASR